MSPQEPIFADKVKNTIVAAFTGRGAEKPNPNRAWRDKQKAATLRKQKARGTGRLTKG